MAGYKILYVADTTALHSHNYTPLEEFRRSFSMHKKYWST